MSIACAERSRSKKFQNNEIPPRFSFGMTKSDSICVKMMNYNSLKYQLGNHQKRLLRIPHKLLAFFNHIFAAANKGHALV